MKASHSLLVAVVALGAAVAVADVGESIWPDLTKTKYRVYVHSSDGGAHKINGITDFQNVALPAVQRGMATWTKANQSGTSWVAPYDGGFTFGGGPNATATGSDRVNRIAWVTIIPGTTTLGITTTTYIPGAPGVPADGDVIDADMELNNNTSDGGSGNPAKGTPLVVWSTSPSGQLIDVESIVLHEAGHYLGLDHTQTRGTAVMNPTYSPGTTKRVLFAPDLADLRSAYPGDSGVPDAGRPDAGTDAGQDAGQDAGRDAGPDSGTSTPVDAGDSCAFCVNGTDCQSGTCFGDERTAFCSVRCGPSPGFACPTGYDCYGTSGGNFCFPQSNSCTNQCTGTGQSSCAVGYKCVGGECQADGTPGSRCDVSFYCQSCSICVGETQGEAYCRDCCGIPGAGGSCTSCSQTSCPANQTCSTLSGGQDKVCFPPSPVAQCGTCDPAGGLPCQAGLTCSGGRCHAPCSLQDAGSCGACSGALVCACPGESATAGQSCSGDGGFPACTTGNACVGATKTCRKLCSAGCSPSEACQLVEGRSVCMPVPDAGQPDAGFDAGFDAGRPDSGFDAGRPDSGFDAGPADAGPADAGGSVPDAGPFDAGAIVVTDSGTPVEDAGEDAGEPLAPDSGEVLPDSGSTQTGGPAALSDGGGPGGLSPSCGCSTGGSTSALLGLCLAALALGSRRRIRG